MPRKANKIAIHAFAGEVVELQAGFAAQTAPRPAPNIPGIPELVFDWEYYARSAGLPFRDAMEAHAHFVETGMFAKLDPAPLVSTEFVLYWAHLNGQPIHDAEDFFKRLLACTAGSETGWSPRMVPRWLSLQLQGKGASDEMPIATLLAMEVSQSGLSLHPGLMPQHPFAGSRQLSHQLAALDEVAIRANSITDLAAYVGQHKDLAKAGMTATAIFDHIWCYGLRQNRLSYLGNKAPRKMTHLQLFRTALAQVYSRSLEGRIINGDLPRQRLPSGSITFAGANVHGLDDTLCYDPATGLEPPGLEQLQGAMDAIAGGGLIVFETLARTEMATPAVHTFEPLRDTELLQPAKASRARRAVYSINLGLYDDMPEPPDLPDCDYFIITDARRTPSHMPWRIVRPTLAERDRKRQCLWYKTHPHLLFPHAEHTLWIDSNLMCMAGSEKVVAAHETLSEVATFQHPDRNCVYEEAKAVIELGLDQAQKVNDSVAKMKAAGMPQGYGLYETNVLYSKPGDYRVRAFFDRWWREIFLGSRRDQMSFTFAAFLTGIEISQLDNNRCAKDSRFFRKRPHRDTKERTV